MITYTEKINSLHLCALFENTAHTLLYWLTETNLEICIPEFYIYETENTTESHDH
jgi:hypothetical protein